MAYNADYAGQQAAAAGQQAYDPSAVDPETAKAYEQAWAQYYAALGTDPNAAAAAPGGQDYYGGAQAGYDQQAYDPNAGANPYGAGSYGGADMGGGMRGGATWNEMVSFRELQRSMPSFGLDKIRSFISCGSESLKSAKMVVEAVSSKVAVAEASAEEEEEAETGRGNAAADAADLAGATTDVVDLVAAEAEAGIEVLTIMACRLGGRGPSDRGGFNQGGRGPPRDGYGNRGPMGGGGGFDDKVELKDTCFIQGIPATANEGFISDVFSTCGEIAKNDKSGQLRIKIYTDRATGEPKGECMITFTDASAAAKCIELYNGQSFPGGNQSMKITLAKFKPGDGQGGGPRGSFGGGGMGRGGGGGKSILIIGFQILPICDVDFLGFGGGGRGGPRGGGGGPRGGGANSNYEARANDWICGSCGNNNFAFRQACNQCKTPRDGGSAPAPLGGPPGSGFGGGPMRDSRGPPRGGGGGGRGGLCLGFGGGDRRGFGGGGGRGGGDRGGDRRGGGSFGGGGGGFGGPPRDRDRNGPPRGDRDRRDDRHRPY
ncbi:hypothetical protein WR25_03928 [Diploscapter pachys]|uniref:RanBP2-type domain-containing protein n=1 Tax=Diploscapter pachys TaxID=2018661 RepID=A0A2A2J0K6_9BILA|nr:hypothetical protein WR25_03928 [Diploscapter pachys]